MVLEWFAKAGDAHGTKGDDPARRRPIDEVIEPGRGSTVQFAFDGTSYEIDLTDENAVALREAFSDYVAAARKVTGRNSRTPSSSTSKGRSSGNELAKIREWAAANGYEVAARGRISQQVRDAYDAAH